MPAQVREPTDFYLSFYRWGVAFRQRENPKSFGANFLEWVEKVSVRLHAPHAHAHSHAQQLAARTHCRGHHGCRAKRWQVPNLQSTMMMQSMAAMAAEYHLDQFRAFYRYNHVIGRNPQMAWERLKQFLDSFAIVGTMKRFDESLLLAHDMVRMRRARCVCMTMPAAPLITGHAITAPSIPTLADGDSPHGIQAQQAKPKGRLQGHQCPNLPGHGSMPRGCRASRRARCASLRLRLHMGVLHGHGADVAWHRHMRGHGHVPRHGPEPCHQPSATTFC